MKFSKYALFAAGCVMFASCSSDEPAMPGDSGQDENATGFIQLDIKLPQTTGMGRALSYEEGDASEYAVTNGRIIVFQKGATEADAVFKCYADLTGMSFGDPQKGEITTSSTTRAQLSNISLSDNSQYAAVVVLNYKNDFRFPADKETFGHWAKTAQTSDMVFGNTLTMTNAAQLVNNKPVVLVDIDKSQIKESESKLEKSAATVHVQRATAKVTVVTPKEAVNPTGDDYKNDKVTIGNWALDITNLSGYPVQVADELDAQKNFPAIWSTARFIGGTKFARAFWAIDPNYDQSISNPSEHFKVISAADVKSNPKAIYCLENTFNIDNMKQGQTTRVVFQATYVPNEANTGIKAGENFFKLNSANKLWSISALKAHLEAAAQTVMNNSAVTADISRIAATPGYHSVSEVTFSGADNITANLDKIAEKAGLLNAADKGIATYNKGEMYYIARIKHFGDEDCPWNIGDPTYDGDNLKYLGRYGMVRNNWYEINVTGISTPGSPIVPEINPDLPDDENKYFIQVQVNVLAWAKRVQNTEL